MGSMNGVISLVGPYLPIVVVGGFILVMIMRGPWSWAQIIMGMMLLGVLYGRWPNLPANINTFVTSVVHSFGG